MAKQAAPLPGGIVAANVGLPVWQALLRTLAPGERAELERLKANGYGYPRVYGRPNPDYARYDEIYEKGEQLLRARLGAGEWIASGYHKGSEVDAPRALVAPDRWPSVSIDADDSSVTVAGVQLVEVRIATAVTLRISTSLKMTTYGFNTLHLSPRSFDLLLVLAEAARAGKPFAPTHELESPLPRSHDDKAVGQGISKLKADLKKSGVSPTIAQALIEPVRGKGYMLNIAPEAILIER
jgi:DNA-binding winged helix-turn-helix (wHTH) protein